MKTEDGKVIFDADEQAEVDRIIQDRLSRVKKELPEDYNDLKEIEKALEEFGYQGTTAEKKAAIKAYQQEIKQQQELDNLQKQADQEGITPALAKKIKDLEDKLEKSNKVIEEITGERTAKQKAEEESRKAAEDLDKQIKEMSEAYPDVDLNELADNAKFKKFIKGKNLPLKELYEDFAEFLGEAEAETLIKVKSKEIRSTSGGKGANSGSEGRLSEDQKKTLDEWNKRNPHMQMSAKEFLSRF